MFLKVHDMFDFPNCLLLPLCRYRLCGRAVTLQYTVVWSSFLCAMPKPAKPGSHTAINATWPYKLIPNPALRRLSPPPHQASSTILLAPLEKKKFKEIKTNTKNIEEERGTKSKKKKKHDPADKAMARMTQLTPHLILVRELSHYCAHFFARSNRYRAKCYWLADISGVVVGPGPTTPALADRGSSSTHSIPGISSSQMQMASRV
jgi:hypothetical protein